MTFRWKLFLSYLILALLLAGSLLWYVNRTLEGRLVAESRENLLHQAQLARLLLTATGAPRSPQHLAEQVGRAIRARVTLIAPDGRVMGDSNLPGDQVPAMENHLQRPEVQQALKTGIGSSLRYSETLRVTMLYLAIPDGRWGGVVRLALPLEYLDAARRSLHAVLGGATAAVLLLALLFSALLASLVARPLRSMADAAARFGAGERGIRIPSRGEDEIGSLGQVLNQMADRLESQMASLAAERQRLTAILHGMGEGVMVLNERGEITLVNPALRGQLGLTGDLLGRTVAEVCRHPDLLQAYEQHRRTSDEVLAPLSLPDGVTLSTHWVPLGDRQGTVAVFHDISALKRAEAIRRDFVANASHELRTPVAVIKGYAETLLDNGLQSDPERSRQFIGVIASHAERLTNLINDILTLSRLESKETALTLAPVDTCAMLRKASLLMGEHAHKQGITLTLALPDPPLTALADHGRLEQVLLNLLDNAIKYTPAGGAVALGGELRGDQVALTVTDTGIGIPPKDLPRIFERFYRVDGARSREAGGTGLGLAIVKHIVQLHGGQVQVQSEPGRGSCFTVLLKRG